MSGWSELLATRHCVAGVDEAGRGPLAGDVIAAAVILPADICLPGLRDSKQVSHARRPGLAMAVREQARDWALGRASVEEIDRLNILQASLLAMQRAVQALSLVPDLVLVDGNRCPAWPYFSVAVVKGDALVAAISAASVLAKVARDEEMRVLDLQYPDYGFALHKGYPTAAHLAALARFGPCPIHRRSFAPVRAAVAQCAPDFD
ncbi:MAG: ribonuclease HII [Pseudomonadales bacterium]|nr:ribonuclease HII [Pseudomonadales bacterium]